MLEWATKNKKNLRAGFLCVLAAGMFWFLNAMSGEYTTQISYPVQLKYNQEKFHAQAELPSSVTISVTGYGWTLLSQSLGFGLQPASYTIDQLPKDRKLPAQVLFPAISGKLKDVRLNYDWWDTLSIPLEPIQQKALALELKTEFASPALRLAEYRFEPDGFIISGPKSLLDSLPDYLEISLLQISQGQNVNRLQVALGEFIPDFTRAHPDTVLLSAEVFEAEELSIDLPIIGLNFPDSLKPLPESLKAFVLVPDTLAYKPSPKDFSIIADFEKLQGNLIPLEVKVQPEYIEKIRLSPSRVSTQKNIPNEQ